MFRKGSKKTREQLNKFMKKRYHPDTRDKIVKSGE